MSSKDSSMRAMTLIDAILVIVVIIFLLGLLLPVLSGSRHSPMTKARLEASDITTAIEAYHAVYGRWPVSDGEQAAAGTNDFTTGLTFGPGPHSLDNNNNVIAILMDLQTYGNGTKTMNFDHAKNPQQTRFINARISGDSSSPGVGVDGVYRDPWGNPYIITMDLNNDGLCGDLLYSLASVSQNSQTGTNGSGFNRLKYSSTNGAGNYFFHGKVMVWSAGPDKKYDSGPANDRANRDNILSWQ